MQNFSPSVSIVTLGCRANQYESDAIARALEEKGFKVVPAEQSSDLCIINTCTVTSESDRKSRQMIRRAKKYADHVIVTGCFAEVSPESAANIEGVDLVISNKVKSKVAEAAEMLVRSFAPEAYHATFFEGCDSLSGARAERVRSYIKIEDGCDNTCSYCIIPRARGPVRSKSRALVFSEVDDLAARDVKEIILTGIEISRYGSDNASGYTLIDLIEDIAKRSGVERISLGSLDPKYMTPEVVSRFSKISKCTHHFHLSIQSGCSKTLRAMRRKYNADQIIDVVGNIRDLMPDAMISVDAIAGFPGETEEDFLESVALLRRITPLHIHSFPYSVREDTEAARLPGQIADGEKRRRNRVLCELSEGLNLSLLEEYVRAHTDKPVTVLCENVQDGVGSGHSEHYVPVRFRCDHDDLGKMVKVDTLRVQPDKKGTFVIGEKAL